METVLTAYNSQVQKWTAPPVKSKKMIRLVTFMAKFNGIFEAVFTDAKKAVLDEILYLTSTSGLATVKGSTLAEKTGYKIRTVRAAVKALKETEQFVVAQTANGRAGAYIFIDKEHENYPLIMKDLFDLDVTPVVVENNHTHHDAQLNAQLDAPLQNSETLDTTGLVDEKEQPISFNSFNSFKKDLKPKQELPSNLYGKVCKEMNIVGQDESVTQVMRMIEKTKTEIDDLTDEIALHAVHEAVNNKANNVAAYARKVINNFMKPSDNVSKPSKPTVKANTPQWFKEGVHKQKHDDSNTFNKQQQAQAKYNVLKKFFDEDAIKKQMGDLYSLVS